jgi:erythromycin esterase-like protein
MILINWLTDPRLLNAYVSSDTVELEGVMDMNGEQIWIWNKAVMANLRQYPRRYLDNRS